jgi:predicted RNase H-like nuclease
MSLYLRKEIHDLKTMVVSYGETERASVQYRDILSKISNIDAEFQAKPDVVDSTLKSEFHVRRR